MKCKEKTHSKNPKVAKTKNEKIMIIWNCGICNSKKSRFIKIQEASGLLDSLEIKTPFSWIPLLETLFFKRYKMN